MAHHEYRSNHTPQIGCYEQTDNFRSMDDDEEDVPSFLRTVAVEEDTAYVLGIHEENTRILTNDTLMAEAMLGEAWC